MTTVQITLDTLDGLESTASDLEARIASDSVVPGEDVGVVGLLGSDADAQSLSAAVTAARTRLVAARTEAERAAARAEREVAERTRRRRRLGEYQSLVLELEHWVLEARGKIGAAAKLASLRAVRDDIHAAEVNGLAILG